METGNYRGSGLFRDESIRYMPGRGLIETSTSLLFCRQESELDEGRFVMKSISGKPNLHQIQDNRHFKKPCRAKSPGMAIIEGCRSAGIQHLASAWRASFMQAMRYSPFRTRMPSTADRAPSSIQACSDARKNTLIPYRRHSCALPGFGTKLM